MSTDRVRTASNLVTRMKREGARLPESTRVRLHRALSWLGRAEREESDPDARFIFLWIAFNAAYAREFDEGENERRRLGQFLDALLAVDEARLLHGLVFRQFTGPIRTLIENKYVFEPFWRALREHDSSNRWEQAFQGSRKAALASVVNGDTAKVLSIVFDRLYVLRNQLVHGGATWNGKVNRTQIRDGARILGSVVPVIAALMLDHPEIEFGDVLYPVV